MTTQTIKMIRPYICTVCGGKGVDPRQSGFGATLLMLPCPSCGGVGILQVEEVRIVEVNEEPSNIKIGVDPNFLIDTLKCPDCDTPIPDDQNWCWPCWRKRLVRGKGPDDSTVLPIIRCIKCEKEIDTSVAWYYADEKRIEIICAECCLANSGFDFAHPNTTPKVTHKPEPVYIHPEPISVDICKDNGETETVAFSDLKPATATAARINARLRKAGYDASMVRAMTPLHMLESAERRATEAEESRDKAQKREAAWVDWFEELRENYEGVTGNLFDGGVGKYMSWVGLERHYPWPSLEDERAEAIQDE